MFLDGFKKKILMFLWKENMNIGLWTHYERIIKDNGALYLLNTLDKVLVSLI